MNSIHNHDAINDLKNGLTICETDTDLFLCQRHAQRHGEEYRRPTHLGV